MASPGLGMAATSQRNKFSSPVLEGFYVGLLFVSFVGLLERGSLLELPGVLVGDMVVVKVVFELGKVTSALIARAKWWCQGDPAQK